MGHTLQRLSALLGVRAQPHSAEGLRKCRGPSWRGKEPWMHCQLGFPTQQSVAGAQAKGPVSPDQLWDPPGLD